MGKGKKYGCWGFFVCFFGFLFVCFLRKELVGI